jgi:hypothetical protein
MVWQCPACNTPIPLSDLERTPQRGVRYRCGVCHLELVVSEGNDAFVVAPFSGDADRRDPKRQWRRRGGRRATDLKLIPAPANLPKKKSGAA